jgi:hypothetical protein
MIPRPMQPRRPTRPPKRWPFPVERIALSRRDSRVARYGPLTPKQILLTLMRYGPLTPKHIQLTVMRLGPLTPKRIGLKLLRSM